MAVWEGIEGMAFGERSSSLEVGIRFHKSPVIPISLCFVCGSRYELSAATFVPGLPAYSYAAHHDEWTPTL